MNYKIVGNNLPSVICELEQNETLLCESGGMSFMSSNMEMETSTNGGFGKALGRMFSGDKIFQNRYTAKGGNGIITFSSCFPGTIKAFEIDSNNTIIVQKHSFLASEANVELSAYLNKKASVGLFGGEGFVMQKLSGKGIAFCEFDGDLIEHDLKAGEKLKISSGYLAAMEENVSLEIETVKGAKNIFFGGEGLFLTTVTGPGKVWLQTMPLQKVADSLRPFFPVQTSTNSNN